MIALVSFFKTIDNKICHIDAIEQGCWVSLVAPTEDEVMSISKQLQIDQSFLRAALDEEETSRIEAEDEQTLIIVDVPSAEKEGAVAYSTFPMGIVVTQDNIVTISLRQTPVLAEFSSSIIKNAKTSMKTRFILTMLLRIAGKYLQYLRQIDKISSYGENQLYKSQRNKELMQLLDLEKSLVYFNTSLRANEVTLEKILRGRIIKLYEEDQDLLEDVLIEIRQGIEMANIYSSILSNMMDAYSSVISNNLNVIMKILTTITILITIPNIIFGYYGMNVSGLLPMANAWFPIALSVGIVLAVGYLLKKKDLF